MSSVPFTLAELDLRERALSQYGRWAKAAQLAAAALVLPQISTLIWWTETHSWIHLRGLVNIEYLLLFAVALLFPGWVTVTALTAELTIALLEPLAHLYYFSPADAIRSFRYLSFIPPHLLVGYSLLLLLYIAGCALFLRLALIGLPRLGSRRVAIGLVAAIMCAWSYDLVTGHLRPLHMSVKHGDADLRTTKVVRAPAASLVYATFLMSHGRQGPGHAMAIPSALQRAMGQIEPGMQPNIVLVLTESWGLALDQRLNDAEVAPYTYPEIARNYQVETGSVGFYGSTSSGETRELCGDASGRWGESDRPGQYRSCWPMALGRKGYKTLAVHGFTPTMYDRDTWYPQLGFSEEAFLPVLQRDGAKMCSGAFPGACDTDVAKWIGNRLEKAPGQPLFVHWVTLTSHLPVAAVQGIEADTNCHNADIADHGSLCAWFNRILDVQRSVAELAEKPGIRPTVFVIVGDHAPPFVRPEARDRFSQTLVPWVVLMPRVTAPAARMFVASGTHELSSGPASLHHRKQPRHEHLPSSRIAG